MIYLDLCDDSVSDTILVEKKRNLSNNHKELSYESFLEKHAKYKKGDDFNYTSITGGKWLIPLEEEELFRELYAAKISNLEGNLLGMLEKPSPNNGPIKIDFDLKYKKLERSVLTIKIIDRIVSNITKIIKESIEGDYMCIVTKRKEPHCKKDDIKDGIHIYYPYIVTDYKYQHGLRNEYLKIMEEDLKDLYYDKKENSLESIYDESVIERNNWFMFLSTKPNTTPYGIIKLYNTTKTLNDFKKMSVLELVNLMSIRNKPVINKTKDGYNKIMNNIGNSKMSQKKKVTKQEQFESNPSKSEDREENPFEIIEGDTKLEHSTDDIERLLNM